MTKEIELTRGFVAQVDDIDFEYLRQFNWCYNTGYAVRRGPHNSTLGMHRVVLERKLGRPLAKGERPDHRDRNRANNTRDNIRLATQKQNMANRSKLSNTSSRFVGVSWHKSACKWLARIRINGCLTHLGAFLDEKEAAKAYDRMAHALYGEFANLNFPDEVSRLNGLSGLYKEPSSKLLILKLDIAGKAVYFFNTYDEFQPVKTLKS